MPCEICGGREEISLCRMCARSEVARKTKFKDDLIEELAGVCENTLLAATVRLDTYAASEQKQKEVVLQLQAVLAKHKDLKNQGLL